MKNENANGSRLRRRKPVARLFLGAFIAMILLGLGFGGWFYLRSDEKPAADKHQETKDARRYDILVTRVRHNAMRNGVVAWTVDAESVGYSHTGNDAKIRKVSAVFFGNDSRPVTATSDEGRIETARRDMELSGSVVIKDDPYTFRTGRVEYQDQAHRMVANQPVSLSGERMEISGDSLDYDINTRTTHVRGHVKGQFLLDGNT